ncbi:PepSY-associated TM helix domain-containing protein [Aquibacillus kalidii]|uniref:PepSY-associated TM helix domain-containing protein n=1 Tax=Aquibacillus kalidii TaxID=2762597 RepID=UPI001F27E648|nr:PepSY domain-containing protein [Aquibacillus kalidii]
MNKHNKEVEKRPRRSISQIIWRWHMYGGIVIAPFLIMLAITGSIYLFKPQIEQFLYDDYLNVVEQEEKLPPSTHIAAVQKEYPEAEITRYRPGEGTTRSAEVKVNNNGNYLTIFVNPYTAEIVGELNDQHRIIDRIEEFHGELMLGTFGDRIVELVACWTLILILTGMYIWMPKTKFKIFGTILPRFKSGKRILIRDLHAIPGFWLSVAITFLVITGLLWSGFWGTKVQTLMTNNGLGYPPSIWVGSAPSSSIQTKEIADVPWAAQNLEVPSSDQQSYLPLSIDDVITITDKENIYPTYEVIYPRTPEGVYSISVFPPKAKDEATLHIDQYTGAILADYRYNDYQPIGKAMAWGITVHKGLEYGLPNQIIGLVVCVGIVVLVISGIVLWWKRKPDGHFGAPKSTSVLKIKKLFIILVIFGILFPLFGLSVLMLWIIDWLIIQRIPRLKHLFQA